MDHNPALPTRAYYKNLASRLILEKELWSQFYSRCEAMASAGLHGHKDPSTVAAAVLKGYSLGMDFMEALGKIKMIDGNPVLRGPSAVAHIHAVVPGAKCRVVTDLVRVDAHGTPLAELVERLCEDQVDCWKGRRCLDPTKISVWEMSRPEWDPKYYVFTMAQAERAGMVARNSTWRNYPERCLKWQAASIGTQEMFGDSLGGMYLEEEMQNAPQRAAESPPAPSPLPPVADFDEDQWANPEDYVAALHTVHARIEALDLAEDFVMEAALGDVVSRPSPSQLDQVQQWLANAESAISKFVRGLPVQGISLKVYESDFERHRPVIEKAIPGSGIAVLWSGGARLSKEIAVIEGSVAGLMVLLEQRLPEVDEDDTPDPEVVAKAEATLKAHQEKTKARNEENGRKARERLAKAEAEKNVAAEDEAPAATGGS